MIASMFLTRLACIILSNAEGMYDALLAWQVGELLSIDSVCNLAINKTVLLSAEMVDHGLVRAILESHQLELLNRVLRQHLREHDDLVRVWESRPLRLHEHDELAKINWKVL